MNLTPERIDAIAAEYALGTLQGGARRRAETLARQRPELREAILRWQHQLASLTELAPPVAPPAALWARIDAVLRADLAMRRVPASAVLAGPLSDVPSAGARRAPWTWLGAGFGFALAAFAVASSLSASRLGREAESLRQQVIAQTALVSQARTELAAVARIGFVSVLADDKAGPALLVTFDPERQQLDLKRVGTYREASEKSLQLWTLAPGQAPKSLGVLGREARERLQALQTDVGNERLLAVSLEPAGGVPSERGPTGPVLFKGPVLAL